MDQQITERVKQEWVRERQRFDAAEQADFPRLPDMPIGRYIDSRFHELELKQFWPKVWLYAGQVDELPDPGCYKLWKECDTEVVIVRGKDMNLRAFYNTCTHRGGPLVTEDSGRITVLACKYHAWTFGLEGDLRFVPEEHEFPGLDKSTRDLVPVRCELWGNFIFINRNSQAAPLLESLRPLLRDFKDFHMDKLRVYAKSTFEIKANWKAVIDNFHEVYHVRQIHPHTINDYLDFRSTVCTMYKGGHSRFVLPMHTGDRGANAQVLDTGGRTSGAPEHEITRNGNSSYTIFPNIITPTAEFQFPLQVFWPTGPRSARMEVIYVAPEGHNDPQSPECQMTVAAFNAVMGEDTSIMNALNVSMGTGALKTVTIGYQERRIYQHHEQIDRVIGFDKVPPDLAMKPMMEAFSQDNW